MKNGLIIDGWGNKYYYLNDQLHRENGPAFEDIVGNKLWYYHGQYIKCKSQKKFERRLRFRAFL
jgi:hypothetical protein